MDLQFLIPILLMLAINGQVTIAVTFQQGTGNVKWASYCDFTGHDLFNQTSSGRHQCGGVCESNAQCSHFTWTDWQGGTCWLKNGPVSEFSALVTGEGVVAVCGYVTTRSGDTGSWVEIYAQAQSTVVARNKRSCMSYGQGCASNVCCVNQGLKCVSSSETRGRNNKVCRYGSY